MTDQFFIFIISHVLQRRDIMESTQWTKTLLVVYKYLDNVAGAIDKIILKTALNSFYFSRNTYQQNNVYNISNRLINLSERKVTLINAKLLVEEILKNIPIKDARLLIQRYFERMKFKDIAKQNDMNIRTVFRKLATAENSFRIGLISKGYFDENLCEMFANETWILNYYKQISGNNFEEIIDIPENLLNRAVAF